MRDARWEARVLVEAAFRAAPGMALLVLALNVFSRLATMLLPLLMSSFVDAVGAHQGGRLATDAVLITVMIVGGTAAVMIAAITGHGGLTSRVDLYFTARVAALINRSHGLALLEQPEQVRELELLSEQRGLLAGGPNALLGLVAEVVRTGVMLWLLASVSPVLILVPLLSVVPFACNIAATRYRGRVDDELALDIRLANRLFSVMATAAPAKELRVFGAGPMLQRGHDTVARRIGDRTRTSGLLTGALTGAGWLVFAAGFAGAMLFVIDRAVHGHATLGAVVLTLLLLQRAQFTASQLAAGTGQLLTAARVAKRLLWLENQVAVRPSGRLVPPGALTEGIVFDHVSFTYPGTTRRVLDDLSVDIPAGTALAVIGDNGAGKTTLVKLLTRMYEPDQGTITVGGIPLCELDVEAWRTRTVASFQDFARYELRAGHVVGLGDLPRLDDDGAVLTALERAGARHLVGALSQGLDTLVGKSFDGGRDLSGGQWQNLALARGRMRDDPLLLVLDEPTANLDAPTEHAVFEQYLSATSDARQRSGAITVIASHRFSTVRRADRILVLDGGRNHEYGSHDELLAADGLYAELFRLQASAYQ
jgi:ATP-binding cassette subfamily B protein